MNGRNRPSGMDWIRRSTRLAIYLRDGDMCVHCASPANLSLHHIKQDGGNAPTNLVTLCMACNQREETAPCPACNLILFRDQTRLPLDRAEGLRRAKARWPERYAKEKARGK